VVSGGERHQANTAWRPGRQSGCSVDTLALQRGGSLSQLVLNAARPKAELSAPFDVAFCAGNLARHACGLNQSHGCPNLDGREIAAHVLLRWQIDSALGRNCRCDAKKRNSCLIGLGDEVAGCAGEETSQACANAGYVSETVSSPAESYRTSYESGHWER